MMNILFIAESNPFGHYSGGQQRTNLVFNALQQIGHVHLFCISNEDPPSVRQTGSYTVQFFGPNTVRPARLHWSRKLIAAFNPYHLYPLNEDFHNRIQELMRKIEFDIVFIRYLPPVFICGLYRTRGLVIDVDDIPHHYYWSLFKSPQVHPLLRLLNLIYVVHVYGYGRSVFKKARLLFYSNPEQARGGKSVYLPNIPFTETNHTTSFPDKGSKRVLFVGTFGYDPNIHGVNHFLKHIWPLVRKEVPDATLDIVGKISVPGLYETWSNVEGVSVHGFVENLDASYANARVAVVPIYEGAGTHIKILEGMHYQKACVVSVFASRGFSDILKHDDNVIIARNDKEFADGVIRFLKDGQLAAEFGRKAAESIAEGFNREQFNSILTSALRGALSSALPRFQP